MLHLLVYQFKNDLLSDLHMSDSGNIKVIKFYYDLLYGRSFSIGMRDFQVSSGAFQSFCCVHLMFFVFFFCQCSIEKSLASLIILSEEGFSFPGGLENIGDPKCLLKWVPSII